MHELTDARPGGIFTKRFWTEPRPRTGTSRTVLLWIVGCWSITTAWAIVALASLLR